MRRLALLAALATLVLVSLTADAATPSFPYGVAAGEVTSTSALLWTRAPRSGPVGVELSGMAVAVLGVRASSDADLTFQVRIPRLRPKTTYEYSFVQGKVRSPVGTFTTAPAATADEPVRFAVSGDADATPGANGQPGFNRFEVYARMAAEKNDFNINLGDTIYSDSEIGGSPVARTVA